MCFWFCLVFCFGLPLSSYDVRYALKSAFSYDPNLLCVFRVSVVVAWLFVRCSCVLLAFSFFSRRRCGHTTAPRLLKEGTRSHEHGDQPSKVGYFIQCANQCNQCNECNQ